MRKVVLPMFMAMLFAFLLVGCGSGEGETGKANNNSEDSGEKTAENNKEQTITFGVTPWTSTVPPTEIASLIVQELGYNVEQAEAETGAVYAGTSNGDIDVFMDNWLPAQSSYLEEYSDSIEEVSVSYDEAASGFVVPEYLENINDVGDIKGKEDQFDNKIYSIGEGDPATDEIDQIIEGYDLDIEQVNSSEAAMIAEAMRRMEDEEPVLFYGWRPHTMFNKMDVKIISNEKTPEYLPPSTVQVVANKELKEKAPDVYEFLSNWSISIDDVEKMILQIEEEEREPKAVAEEWINNNEEKVNKMIGE